EDVAEMANLPLAEIDKVINLISVTCVMTDDVG
ncbi:hypothetical protein ACAG01_25145, partial [Escherichia coli]